jgi:hypothetical protein
MTIKFDMRGQRVKNQNFYTDDNQHNETRHFHNEGNISDSNLNHQGDNVQQDLTQQCESLTPEQQQQLLAELKRK